MPFYLLLLLYLINQGNTYKKLPTVQDTSIALAGWAHRPTSVYYELVNILQTYQTYLDFIARTPGTKRLIVIFTI